MRDIASTLDYLQCPRCTSGELSISASAIKCDNCFKEFPLEAGIPNFIDPSSEFLQNQFWQQGQVGEKAVKFWEKVQERGGYKGPSPFTRIHALAQYQKCLELRHGAIPKSCLEIGPGSKPRMFFYEISTKFALDPLMNLYLKLFPESYENIACLASIAESIPLKSNSMDYVILSNCLDHFSSPEKGLLEVLRVMSPDGICFISLETFNRFWKMERRLFDKVHEYRWTPQEQKEFLESCGAVILDYSIDPPEIKEYYAKYFITDWKSRLAVMLGRIRTSWIFISKK
jgi:SAM-dependent methyltransferase